MNSISKWAFCLLVLFQLVGYGFGAGLAVMSVDLGNEFIKIGIVSPGKPMETVLNTDSARKTPMIVAFRDGERLFGEAALSVGIRFPDKVFTRLLDLVGKPLDHPVVQNYIRQFPYHNITANENNDGILLTHPEGDVFTPEELLAMILERSQIYAEHFLANEIKIKNAVLVIPSYLNQAERVAILNSAKIAGLNVLQLVNANTAVSLHYGLFRINDFSVDKPKNIIFYDMGSGSTEVTVATFQLRKKNDGAYPSTVPELSIRGVGFDRNLGGFEMQMRLRDHLVKLFVEQHGAKDKRITAEKIRENKRAMSKLLKEAGRVKTMLSANNDIQARVENVVHDLDLKATVSRTDYEDICGDLLTSRATKPLEDALHLSGLTSQEIEQVVLFGGNTRTPKIQKTLLEFLSSHELSKNVNSDEAASLGGAYLAAGLSKGFRVKSFEIREFNIFPIAVEFARTTQGENDLPKTKQVQRVLFAKGNSYPIRKVITFNKNTDDFDFNVNYGDLSFLTQAEQSNVGNRNLFKAQTSSLKDLIEKYNNDQFEHKGIRAHFYMDPNGVLRLEKVDYSVNERVEVTVESNDTATENESNIVRDTLSNLGETVSNLFNQGGGATVNETEGVTTEEEQAKPEASESTQEQADKGETKSDEAVKDENASGKQFKKEIKLKPVKVPVEFSMNVLYSSTDDTLIENCIQKLNKYSEKEQQILEKEKAKNAFESFLVETKAKLYENEYEQASVESEREKYFAKLSEASDWLEYESDAVETSAFVDKLKEISQEFESLFTRVHEHRIRPEALASLNDFLNKTDEFLKAVSNLKEDDQVFTEVEISTLQKLIDETKEWRDTKVEEQNATPLHETPKLVSNEIQEKIAKLDRELKYLYHKQQLSIQKKRAEKLAEKKKAEQKEAERKESENKTSQDATEEETPAPEAEQPSEETNADSNPLNQGEEFVDPSKASDIEIDSPHTEL